MRCIAIFVTLPLILAGQTPHFATDITKINDRFMAIFVQLNYFC